MPTKLSAHQNNCALHAITPELKAEILALADPEHQEQSTRIAEYERLKTCFEQHYDVPEMNFEQFGNILKKYNDFDLQIIMGPVLRDFLKIKLEEDRERLGDYVVDVTVDQFIAQKTSLMANGRYNGLNLDELAKYVAAPLGLDVKYTKVPKLTQGQEIAEIPESQQVLPVPNPIAPVDIYHEGGIEGELDGGHFERSPFAQDSPDLFESETTQLRNFVLLQREGGDATSLIKAHVQNTHLYMMDPSLDLEGPDYKRDITALNVEAVEKMDTVQRQEVVLEERFRGSTTAMLNRIPPTASSVEKALVTDEMRQKITLKAEESAGKPIEFKTDEEVAAELQAEEYRSGSYGK
jgi:hypothetical protein